MIALLGEHAVIHPWLSDAEFARVARLTGRDFASRRVACGSCGAREKEPCWAATGLMASGPCGGRLADAAAAEAGVAA